MRQRYRTLAAGSFAGVQLGVGWMQDAKFGLLSGLKVGLCTGPGKMGDLHPSKGFHDFVSVEVCSCY